MSNRIGSQSSAKRASPFTISYGEATQDGPRDRALGETNLLREPASIAATICLALIQEGRPLVSALDPPCRRGLIMHHLKEP